MGCFNSAFSRAWDTCRLWLVGYSWYLPGVGVFVDCSGFGFDFCWYWLCWVWVLACRLFCLLLGWDFWQFGLVFHFSGSGFGVGFEFVSWIL